MKKVAILGSTGSIGINTLEVISEFPDLFNVTALSANTNVELIFKQIKRFEPEIVVMASESAAESLRKYVGTNCKVLSGESGLLELAKNYDYDIFIGAMVGFAGLAPTIEAIKRSKRIGLANKETLVVAGSIIKELVKKHNAELLPIDSEHSAIFQCLEGEETVYINKLILTASGGPFLNRSKTDFDKITIAEALNHPNWKMGNKITIDSATMMNKGLEIIEAYWLFGIEAERIDVVVHPQSIIHSLVEFVDGSIKAQLSTPDMKLPIQYALGYPKRLNKSYTNTKLPLIQNLTFYEPDYDKFECLKLAHTVLNEGGTAPCILNAANEIAVDKFLKSQIKFSSIPEIIMRALNGIQKINEPDIDAIIECDSKTRLFTEKLLS